jgi:hypothetical protein
MPSLNAVIYDWAPRGVHDVTDWLVQHVFHPIPPALTHADNHWWQATWHLTPLQHVVEYAFINIVLLFLFLYFVIPTVRAMKVPPRPLKSAAVHPAWLWIGRLHWWTLAACFLAQVYYKNNKPTVWEWPFLLQPCHMWSLLLFVCSQMRPSVQRQLLFHIGCYAQWGTVLALVLADTRNCSLVFERYVYWIQHIFLLTTPFAMIASGQFTLSPFQYSLTFATYVMYAMYHYTLVAMVALLTGFNIQFMMQPATSDPVLIHFGDWYRPVMVAASVFLFFGFATLFHGSVNAAQRCKSTRSSKTGKGSAATSSSSPSPSSSSSSSSSSPPATRTRSAKGRKKTG